MTKKSSRKKKDQEKSLILNEDLLFENILDKCPFIIIIGRFDDRLGPTTLYTSYRIENNVFLDAIMRTALTANTKSIDFDKEEYGDFRIQAWNFEIMSKENRGGSQLFTHILLRSKKYLDLIPPSFFQRMEERFRLIGNEKILNNNTLSFRLFTEDIIKIYYDKFKNENPLPLENLYKNIRDHINGIVGFSEFYITQMESKDISKEELIVFFKDTIESCGKIIEVLEKPISVP